MANIDDFKSFVRKNPSLITYVKNNNDSWQKIYEVYDLYGEDNKAWEKYLKPTVEESKSSKSTSLNDLVNMAKNIDVDKVQNGITSLQKALGLFSELFVNKGSNGTTNTYQPRAIYKRFED